MLTILLQGLSAICSIISLVCFIMVLVQMFKRGESTMGIVCIVTIFCCVGGLIAFVYGWTKAAAWDIKNIMIAWSVVIVLNMILSGIVFALAASTMPADFNFDPNNMNFEIDMGDATFEIPEGISEPEVTPAEQP